ncbi:MAG: hypothetical protein MPJ78_11380 [Hyphomicrobiaceae bacterium]|nr:hypothetical protein [Hyphomicrobiaceae bacterium]
MKKVFANIALACVVTLLCLAVAEVGLRALTPFPIHGKKANKIYDKDVGYRLNPGHPNIDEHGFRNKPGKPRIIAAIGDSHTYGSNVMPEQAWPEQFGRVTGIPVYNFGIGSYAVYAHFANAHKAIEQGYKYVIIALLIHNDFKVNGNSCDIDYASSGFWQAAKQRLSLHLPDCSNADNWRTARAPGFIRWFRGRGDSAILSATDYLIVRPLSDLWYRSTYKTARKPVKEVKKPEKESASKKQAQEKKGGSKTAHLTDAVGQPPQRPASAYFAGRAILNQEVEFAFTDLTRPEIGNGIEDFEKMLADLKQVADAKGAKVGLMFIPSKVQLFYEYLDDLDVYRSIPILKDMAVNHQAIENRLMSFMDRIGFVWSTAKPELVAAIEKSDRDSSWVFPPTGGHPYPVGYSAYAEAAKKLYERMSASTKTASDQSPPATSPDSLSSSDSHKRPVQQ